MRAVLRSHRGAYGEAAAALKAILAEIDGSDAEAEQERIEVLLALADALRRAGDSPQGERSPEDSNHGR